MPELNQELVRGVLDGLSDPETGRAVTTMDQVHGIETAGGRVAVKLGLTSHSGPLKQDFLDDATDLLRRKLPAETQVSVEIVPHERPPEKIGEIGLTAKSVIAVGSGKGGVGKSTIAASLAFALQDAGSRVGLMDADVYGPSVPTLLGCGGAPRPEIVDGKIQPVVAGGMPVMSIGFMVPPDQAVIWRGPMLHGAITQFLRDTAWGALDYLIIDLPPGTGDIALTLAQALPLTGAVVVCTPQEVALVDAVKAIAMFGKVGIPLLGVVENMSYFLCPDNGKKYFLFGEGGARAKAEELDVPFLGDVPINIAIRERGDAGETSANLSDAETAACFRSIAYRLAKGQADKNRAAPPKPVLPVL